jgi:signal transduction histidine kinase
LLAEAVDEAALDALIGFEEQSDFQHDIEPTLSVQADSEHLHRILVNLMRNAAQAMQAHTRADKQLNVRALAIEGRVEVDVIDKGPGVRADVRDKLFDPFVSADSERGGTGLGLAIARELARAMGGELALTRTGAEGATFTLTLKGM